MKDIFQKCFDFQDANLVRMSGLYPYFQPLGGSEGPTVRLGNSDVIMLGSNNYLGLTHHPKVIAAAHEAIDRYGSGCTGSRFLNGNLEVHDELERELAAFFGREDALVYAAGFLANTGSISCLGDDPDTVIFSDAENHASIIEGTRMIKAELRIFENAEDLAKQLAEQDRWEHAMVVTEGIFSMTGRVLDLRPFIELKRRYGFRLYFDDAHGIGVLGNRGRGTADEQGFLDEVDILFGTFSKSLASQGGFVAGERTVIDYLRHKARSEMFTAGLSPASAAAALAALRVMQEEDALFDRLRDNAAYFKRELEKAGYCTLDSRTPILPIFVGSESLSFRMVNELFQEGIFTTPVVYPAVPYGQALIRTSVTPAHTREHLDLALDALRRLRDRYPLPEVDMADLPRAEEMDWTWFFPQQEDEARRA